MSDVFPPAKLACQEHFATDCTICFTPSDPMHGDQVDQRIADLELENERLEAELDSATTRGRELVDEAVARAEKAEAELTYARAQRDTARASSEKAAAALQALISETHNIALHGADCGAHRSMLVRDCNCEARALMDSALAARNVLGG